MSDVGCCTSCHGLGVGGPASGPETNGRCADCRGEGCAHDGPCPARPACDWCETCEEPADVVEVSEETSGAEETERQWHVTRLSCGHEIAVPLRQPRWGWSR